MYGFTIVYNSQEHLQVTSGCRISFQSPTSGRSCVFTHRKSAAFREEKIMLETTSHIIGIDGLLLNLVPLTKSYAAISVTDLLSKLHEHFSTDMFNQFRGEFTGFMFNKESEELLFFMNQTGTKACYYARSGQTFVVSPSLRELLSLAGPGFGEPSLEVNAAYSLLVMGGMTGSQTLVDGVQRLLAGEMIRVTGNRSEVLRYHDFNTISPTIHSRKEAIARLDELFQRNINLEYSKDAIPGSQFVATLSGGLDSRMNVMAAAELGYRTQNFCFSEPGYADQRISEQISRDLGSPHSFVSLEGGDYVLDFEQNMAIHEGLIFYVSSAHYRYALSKIPCNNCSMIHTGQIGDAVLGGFMTKSNTITDYYSKRLSSKLIHKLPVIREGDWASVEVFRIYNRLFNVTVSGSYVTEHMGMYLVSPFLEPDFIDLCLSLDPSLKSESRIYIDWIRAKRPQVARYVWERTGFRPNASWKNDLSRITNKMNSLFRKVTGNQLRYGMNPYDYWFQTRPEIKSFMMQQFRAGIDNIGNPELKSDCRILFESGNTIEKTLVLTLLGGIEMLNLKS
jgi:asparagine synthase (glutamine-hydrolysing)